MKTFYTILALLLAAGQLSAQEATPVVTSDTVLAGEVESAQSSEAVPQPVFGYFSYSETMKAMPEYAIAQKSLADLRATYDQELERAEKDFSRKYAEFLEGQKTFPENIMLKRQKELQMLMDQGIQFKNEAKELLAKAESELMEPIRTRLDAAVQSVGYEQRYLYILNTDAKAYPYISAAGVDCTSLILQKLGQ